MFANVVMYKNLIYIALVSLSYLTSFDRDLGKIMVTFSILFRVGLEKHSLI